MSAELGELLDELVRAARACALRDAAEDFDRAAEAGIEPALNHHAATLLRRRAERMDRCEHVPPSHLQTDRSTLAP